MKKIWILIIFLSFSNIFAIDHAYSLKPADLFMKDSTEKVFSQLDQIQGYNRHDLLNLIQKEIMPHVDSVYMAKWVVGRQPWTGASRKEQDEFINAFMDLLINSYANTLIILKDKPLDFKIANKKSAKSLDKAQVLCVVGQVGQDPIHVLFQMKVIDGKWKVFDVIVEGISLLKGLKAQFSDDIHNFGIKVVTDRIEHHQYQVKGPMK